MSKYGPHHLNRAETFEPNPEPFIRQAGWWGLQITTATTFLAEYYLALKTTLKDVEDPIFNNISFNPARVVSEPGYS